MESSSQTAITTIATDVSGQGPPSPHINAVIPGINNNVRIGSNSSNSNTKTFWESLKLQLESTTLFLMHRTGPTVFNIRDEEDKSFKGEEDVLCNNMIHRHASACMYSCII